MPNAITIIGNRIGTSVITVPVDQSSGISALQAELDAAGAAVTVGSASFVNWNIFNSGEYPSGPPAGSGLGLFEVTNTDADGAVSPGAATNFFGQLPVGYSTCVVQAPGAETILGNQATNVLAVFGAQSSVSLAVDGTGTVVASDNNFIQVGGSFGATNGWSVIGGSGGADTINTTSESTSITTQGAGNVVGLAGIFSTLVAGGTGDLIAGYGGENVVSVTGTGDSMQIFGGSETIYAAPTSSNLDIFAADLDAAPIDFVNQSSVTASVFGGGNYAGGSVTAFGGMADGLYVGGSNGNNSLVGGSGTCGTTLIGGGINNFLSVQGSGPNALFADGNATVVAGANTQNNIFVGGFSAEHVSSFGSGHQDFFAGKMGSESLTGSTAIGATNTYYFEESQLDGGGTETLINFRLGIDHVFINPFASDATNGIVSIQSCNLYTNDEGSFSALNFSDNTTIKLYNVQLTAAQQASIVGSTFF